jgi:uncharacterized protein (DUF934 family)
MPLVKNDALVEDIWVTVPDGDPVPTDGPVILNLARWREEGDTLRARNAPLGIRLASDQSPTLIAEDLGRFDVVALEFPAFSDGRAFSSASILRGRLGFAGEVRAVGDVRRDQLDFMARCGFDAFEIGGDGARALDDWRAARAEISVRYQPAADNRPTALSLRERRRQAARPAPAPAARPARDADPAEEPEHVSPAAVSAAVLDADDYLASSSLGGYWAY